MISGVLGANVASGVLITYVTPEVLSACLFSGAPSMVWPPVEQKSSTKVVGQDIEPRREGAVGGC